MVFHVQPAERCLHVVKAASLRASPRRRYRKTKSRRSGNVYLQHVTRRLTGCQRASAQAKRQSSDVNLGQVAVQRRGGPVDALILTPQLVGKGSAEEEKKRELHT